MAGSPKSKKKCRSPKKSRIQVVESGFLVTKALYRRKNAFPFQEITIVLFIFVLTVEPFRSYTLRYPPISSDILRYYLTLDR